MSYTGDEAQGNVHGCGHWCFLDRGFRVSNELKTHWLAIKKGPLAQRDAYCVIASWEAQEKRTIPS